jgi:hypothetical protein
MLVFLCNLVSYFYMVGWLRRQMAHPARCRADGGPEKHFLELFWRFFECQKAVLANEYMRKQLLK